MENVFRSHFSFLFDALERDRGRPFTALPSISVPVNENLQWMLMFELWSAALASNATDAFHTLTLYTHNQTLEHVLKLCVDAHAFGAVLPVVAKLERRDGEGLLPRLGSIECARGCSECAGIRQNLLAFLSLDADWALCRAKMADARAKNLWTMHKPKLLLSADTDAVCRHILHVNRRGWTSVFAAVCAVRMWRQWVARRLDPESSFVMNVLSARFAHSCQTQRQFVLGWGGEEEE